MSTKVNTGMRELLGELHQAQRLAVALGLGHAEVARDLLLGVAALLVADHHAGLAVEARQPADDRSVVGEGAVAVQLLEIGEQALDVVERVRALRMARDLRDLPRRELAVDVLGERLALLVRRSISSEMSTAESSCTKRSSSMLVSSSAIGCSKSRKVVFTGARF